MKVLSLFLASYLALPLTGAITPVKEACDLVILNPSLAERKTGKFRLENGLEVYLISDPNATDSGAALTVDVGSLSDPKEYPGMAHFCEHMLFMGTEKYPDEKEYHRFLEEHGGMRNACTSSDRTLYMFAINHEGFEGALQRFSHFFISPLFKTSCVQRERNAVDSEFTKNISSDLWRVMHVQKELANNEHPFHEFSTGNAITLGAVTQDILKKWYESHYSANIMHLVVYSPLAIEEMQTLVEKNFSDIKNRNLKKSAGFDKPLFSKELLGKLIVVEPRLEVQKLELCFEIPKEFLDNLEVRPDMVASFILGHEGSSSLLDILKKEKLALGLSASAERISGNQGVFTICINLTTSGVKSYGRVIDLCFSAINTYANTGVPKYLFDEMCQMEKISFAYQQRKDVFDFVTEIALKLPDEPLETFPKLTLMPVKYDQKTVKSLFNCLKKENCCFTLIAPPELTKVKMNLTEKWMKVPYSLANLNLKTAETALVATPKPNPFIPKDLKLVNTISKETAPLLNKPTLIQEDESAKIYYGADDRFSVPEVCLLFTFKTPLIKEDELQSKILADLFCLSVNEKLSSLSYTARLGGLHFSLEPEENGLSLAINGYSEKASDLLYAVVDEICRHEATLEEFNLYKEELSRRYKNASQKSPLCEAQEELFTLLYKDYCGPTSCQKAVDKVSYEHFVSFSSQLLQENYMEATLSGNLTENMAKEIAQTLKDKLPQGIYAKEKHYRVELASFIEDPCYVVRKSKLPENALILTIDANDFNFERGAAIDVLSKALEEPFFSELRTRQQTAYLVHSLAKEMKRHHYLLFLIQSSTHDTRDLLARFELFLESNLQQIAAGEFTEERFELIRGSLISNLTHTVKDMQEMASLCHELAFEYDGDFAWIEKKIEALQKLTFDEFSKIAFEVLGKKNKKRLAVSINGVLENENVLSYRKGKSTQTIKKTISYKGAD